MRTPTNLKHRRPESFSQIEHERQALEKKRGIVFFALSFIVHSVVFGAMLFFQDFSFPKPMPPVIQVDLVSFAPDPVLDSTDESRPPADKESVAPKAKKVQSKPKKIKHIKADISLKTKPQNLKALMEKQRQEKLKALEKKPEKKPEKKEEATPEKKPEEKVDNQEELNKAQEELERKVEDQEREKIAQALSRLKEKIKDQGNKAKEGRQSKGAYAGKGRKGHKPIDIYHQVIKFSIRQNWVYTDIFANMDQKLEVVILIKILASGEIRDVFYETRSGNRYLDESAKKAIMKINPLPPLPSGMPYYDLGLIFTPKGLK